MIHTQMEKVELVGGAAAGGTIDIRRGDMKRFVVVKMKDEKGKEVELVYRRTSLRSGEGNIIYQLI